MIENGSTTPAMVVFSDLDGTLLDHESYDWEPARPALIRLREAGIPLILASSKTAAEMLPIRDAIGFSHCEIIVENGAGVLGPNSGPGSENDEHARILKALSALPGELACQFTGFSDWSAEQIAEKTGLSHEQALLARERAFSEPGLWSGTQADFARFSEKLQAMGVQMQRGGRFISLSLGGTKAVRMAEIASRYKLQNSSCLSVALGDAMNDIGMIEQADFGIIVANPAHAGIPHLAGEKTGTILRSVESGPSGWNEMMMKLLDRFVQERIMHG